MSGLLGVILFALAIAAAVIVFVFILIPLLKGLFWLIGNLFKGIGWVIQHIFGFIFGMIGDAIRLVGSILAMLVLAPMVPLNVVIGRWSAAGHFAESVKRECKVLALCAYRIVLQRPLRLVLLHGLLEGLEKRVPEALAGAPTSDRPSRRTGQFDGYTIVGSLRGGGSGGKLYIAQPTNTGRTARIDAPERVVIKSFALTDGSSLPQIIRESRALEAARKLGLVIDHSLDDHRFWYVMPYHSGDSLGVMTRQLHAESGERGLTPAQIPTVMGYFRDLLKTVSTYHRGGLWHKDIKPENIIINEDGAHLVDLGLVTPLRSAMTLTTHGTEYFRDPEMVRLALRGVKVHQVDGAKFDIFAMGAVLYFVLENTFPAHGGLSRFTRRSPEALRWIVRRAMADYNKRYESADVLLADLDAVMAARDPFAVKPVDLPSMGGAVAEHGADVADFGDDVESVEHAATPKPQQERRDPWATGFGFAAGIGADGPFATPLGSFEIDEDFNVRGATPKPHRPRLSVTNWWTGRYAVDFVSAQHSGAAAPAAGPHSVVQQAAATVRSTAHQARRAAREQVREARARARKMRTRAANRRTTSLAERQPGLAVVFTTLIVIGGLALIAFSILNARRVGGTYLQDDSAVTAASNRVDGPPLLVINDLEDNDSPAVQRRIDKIKDDWRNNGYDVVADDPEAQNVVAGLYEQWLEDPDGPVDEQLEDALERFNYYGILHIRLLNRSGAPHNRIIGSHVYSTRDGAEGRRRTPTLPLLMINDHPDANVDDIADWIDDRIDERRDVGFEIVTRDVLAEATLQPYLELWKQEGADAVGDDLTSELIDLGYGGVLLMTEGQAYGPAKLRVNEMQFIADLSRVATADQSTRHMTTSTSVSTATSTSRGPLLLINDHPAKADPSVDSAIRSMIDRYRRQGIRVVIDDEVEVLVRRLLPIGSAQTLDELSDALAATLAEHDLDGIVRIISRPGGGASNDRIDIEKVMIDESQVAVSATSSSSGGSTASTIDD